MAQAENGSDGRQPSGEDVQLARLRIKLGFWKFLIGTVAVSVLTSILNWQIQWKQLEMEKFKTESEFIGKFIQLALDDNPEKRRDFAEYFWRLTPTTDSKLRWDDYRAYALDLVEQSKAKQAALEAARRDEDEARQKELKAARGLAAAQERERVLQAQIEVAKDAAEKQALEESQRELAEQAAEAERQAAEARKAVNAYQSTVSERSRDLASLRSEATAKVSARSDVQIAQDSEREGFERLIALDFAGAQAAFEAAERAYPSYHQVYEIAGLLRRNRSRLDDPGTRRLLLLEIGSGFSTYAPPGAKAALEESARRAGEP